MIKVLVGIKPKPHDRSEAGPFLCPCQGQFPDLHPILGPCILKGSMFAFTSSFCHLEILNNFWMRHSYFHCSLSSTNYVAGNTLYQCSVILCYSSNQLLNCMWINPSTVCQLANNVFRFCQNTWSTHVSHLQLTLCFRYIQLFTVTISFFNDFA